MKKLLFFLISLGLCLAAGSGMAQAVEQVAVSLPNFSITLNGVAIDNAQREYPLLVYQGITYFPMTYHDCRFTGLETVWDSAAGLSINQTDISGGYRDGNAGSHTVGSQWATIPHFAIQVNGKSIDNAAEEYPLLNYRDVTYFPLTWRFAVDEFAWDYAFDATRGLVINSTNPSVERLRLSHYQEQEDFEQGLVSGAFTLIGEYIYYRAQDDVIYRAPLSDPAQRQEAYRFAEPLAEQHSYTLKLGSMEGELTASYYSGGATMGGTVFYKVSSDGSAEQLSAFHKGTMIEYQGKSVKVSHFVPPITGNLYYGTRSDGEYEPLGDPGYLYGWSRIAADENLGVSASKDMVIVDGKLYIIAIPVGAAGDYHGSYSRLVRVDMQTGITEKLSDIPVVHFVVEGDQLWMLSDNSIYRLTLPAGTPELMVTAVLRTIPSDEGLDAETTALYPTFPGRLAVLRDQLYYCADDLDFTSDEASAWDRDLYRLGQKDSVQPQAPVTSLSRMGDYIVAGFEERPEVAYRLMVFDAAGQVVFRSADAVRRISVDGHHMVYAEQNSGALYRVVLP